MDGFQGHITTIVFISLTIDDRVFSAKSFDESTTDIFHNPNTSYNH